MYPLFGFSTDLMSGPIMSNKLYEITINPNTVDTCSVFIYTSERNRDVAVSVLRELSDEEKALVYKDFEAESTDYAFGTRDLEPIPLAATN